MARPIGMVDVLYQPGEGSCGSPAEALREMDAAGVAVAMISQCKKWLCQRQFLCVDTRLEDVVRFLGESIRFAGLAGYNPFDAAESVREMEAARALGFRGTYLHLASFGLRLTDARLYPLYAKSTELSQPAIVQAPLGEPELAHGIERVCRDFPELSLAIAYPRPEAELFALCESWERLALVLDTPALAWAYMKQRALFEDPAKVERCLWGSNGAPLVQSASEALAVGLPLDTLEAVVRTNALRYFAAEPPLRKPQAVSDEVTSAER